MRQLCCLALFAVGVASADSAVEATLRIGDTDQATPILSPGYLFGSFFEDFLHGADGGVYGEKVSNRALALPLANSTSFRCTGAVGAPECTWFAESGTVTRDASVPLNDAVPHAMWLQPGAVASNAGFPGGIAVQAGEALELSLFAYAAAPRSLDNPLGSVNVTLEARVVDGMPRDGGGGRSSTEVPEASGRVLASVMLAYEREVSASPQWTKLTGTLNVTAASGADGCRLQLRAVHSGTTDVNVGVTVVSLFPRETFNGRPNGMRKDVGAWLNESRPAFMRTPGGCFVEGRDLVNGWLWKRTLGPVEARPGHDNDVWGYWSDDGMGMFELLRMADDVGARPLLVVNAGCAIPAKCVNGTALEPFIRDALDAVEYATGASTTEWGARRVAAGRAAPYELVALGIGNENCHDQQYASNFVTIAAAVRAKYPNLPLVLGCQTQDQMRQMLEFEPRIASLATMYDVHQRKTPQQFIDAAHEFDAFPRRGAPKVFVSEYSSPRKEFPNSTTLSAAVAEAVYMAGMEANGDVVQLATYGDLVANSEDDHGSAGVSTISINAATSFGSPSWVVQKLFMAAQPTALVPSNLTVTSPATQPSPSPAPGVGIPGCCGGATYNRRRTDCDMDGRGMWDAREKNISNLAQCITAVAKCKMGNFASFYPAVGDDGGSCGWHFSCRGWPSNVDQCTDISNAYVSARARDSPPAAQANCTAWASGGTCTMGTGTVSGSANGVSEPRHEPAQSMLASSVSVGTAGETLAKLVNYASHAVNLTVLLDKGTPAVKGTVSWMTGAPDDVNSFEEPRRIRVQKKAVAIGAGKVVLQLPPWSVSILSI